MVTTTTTYNEALTASQAYFDGDDLAAQVFLGKYALTDPDGNILEKTPRDMHHRLAKEFARIENKYPNPMSEKKIFDYLDNFKYIVPQGSPMAGVGNPFQVMSISNCFVVESPYDSYGGILKTDQEEAQIMKRRGGVGFDISTIRPRGVLTANAAKTTDGIGIFMDRFSNTCREVAQDGRRGALMLTLSVHHPEIETFVNIKRDKERVTGANISVRLSDEFMKAVKDGTEVQLRWPVQSENPTITRMVDARSLWTQIIEAAHDTAEPGLLFWDTIKRESPADCYPDFQTVSTNPCVVGSTLIAVADGRNAVSIEQLTFEGRDVPVYSTNPLTGKVEIKWGRNPRKTGEKKEVWKLTLDDGTSLVATPDHKILLRSLDYVALKDLKPGQSVFPFYSFNSNRYRQIANTGKEMTGGARRNRRQYRLIAEFNNVAVDPKTHAIHHANFNSADDRIENLRVLLHEEHRKLHAEKMTGQKNPYHRQSSEWKLAFASKPGETNPKYSGFTNEQLLEHGKKLFDQHGKLTNNIWVAYAKENGLPQHLGNDFRFGSFKNFTNQVATNHKVHSVEFCGYEDVFNITVDDNHNYHVITGQEDEKFITSSGLCVKNCGEITLSPYDSCRLLLVNTVSFVDNPFTDKARFNFKKYGEVVQAAQRLMDDIIDLELECIDKIVAKIQADQEPEDVKKIELDLWAKIRKACVQGRRTGLGVTAVGDMVASMNVRYGSEESISLVEEVYKHLALNAYRSSVYLAMERGAFPAYNHDLEKHHPFLNKIMELDADLWHDWKKYGRRNIALTTTAPAGTVSVMTQTTSGIEPAFEVSYKRRKKINPNDKEARVDFIDDLGDKWQEYTVHHHWFKKWMNITGETDVEKSPYFGARANDINWVNKVKAQAAAQRWICHSISNTTNVPADTSVDVIKQIYLTGWESGCKGVTVYRDGARSGVLLTNKPKKDEHSTTAFDCNHAPKRPKELPADIHTMTVKGEKWTFFVGKLEGKPYEIMGGLSKFVNIPKRVVAGKIVKHNGPQNPIARYDLHYDFERGPEDEAIVRDITTAFDNATHAAFTRTLSLALRHGAPVQYVVEQLLKGSEKDDDLYSFSRAVSRVLKQYIQDGTKVTSDKKCPSCGATELVYQEGCMTCKACGTSKCG